jgi:hypothetical protein
MGKRVNYVVGSDLHDSPKISTCADYSEIDLNNSLSYDRYLPKHCALAEKAKESKADLIFIDGDLIKEDNFVESRINKIDERIFSYVFSRLDSADERRYSLIHEVQMYGKGKGINGIKELAKNSSGMKKKKLEKIIFNYEREKPEDLMNAVETAESLKKKVIGFMKEDIDNLVKEIEQHYIDTYIPALIEAYSCFSGKVLLVQGNHDPDVLRKLDGVANFVFIDQMAKPYEFGPLKIAGAGNFDRVNNFPKSMNFDLPQLYKKCEFDVFESDFIEEFNKFEKENLERHSKMNPNEVYREFMDFEMKTQERLRNSSPVFKRLSSAFNDTNMLVTHAGTSIEGWNALNCHIKKDENNKNLKDKNNNFIFEDPLFNNGLGMDYFIKTIKPKFVVGAQIHQSLEPFNKYFNLPDGEKINSNVLRTDPETAFLCTVGTNDETNDLEMICYKSLNFEKVKED